MEKKHGGDGLFYQTQKHTRIVNYNREFNYHEIFPIPKVKVPRYIRRSKKNGNRKAISSKHE